MERVSSHSRLPDTSISPREGPAKSGITASPTSEATPQTCGDPTNHPGRHDVCARLGNGAIGKAGYSGKPTRRRRSA
jgi:hypothetical protein